MWILEGAQDSVPVTLYVLVDCSNTEETDNSLLKTVLPILIDIEGSGFPPIEVQVQVFVVPEMTVLGPVRVGVCGEAGRQFAEC